MVARESVRINLFILTYLDEAIIYHTYVEVFLKIFSKFFAFFIKEFSYVMYVPNTINTSNPVH